MKRVLPSRELAHLWANKAQREGRNAGNTFFFDGDSIYSYGHHFEIARHVTSPVDGAEAILFTTYGWGITTAKHKSYVARAISGRVFHVPLNMRRNGRMEYFSPENALDSYVSRIDDTFSAMKRARSNTPYLLSKGMNLRQETLDFCVFYGLPIPDRLSEAKDSHDEKALADHYSEIHQRHEANKSARLKVKLKADVLRWHHGENVQLPPEVGVYLRLQDREFVHTSQGATVPASHAVRLLAIVNRMRRLQSWYIRKEDDPIFRVGHYTLDAVTYEAVTIGCHRISWEEIDRFTPMLKVWDLSHGRAERVMEMVDAAIDMEDASDSSN